ncbi:Conserved_hypothetical protein [Hexamita inflata]|uniref:Uncharacterized protein n=1 Tax=Hexamita inflata TaxID=28002 RepID=A0AA86PQK2_9EUKA|nr:Conserved hypothetical protein [Hexamita inflata]CAI9978391.1 Conserved hypothetical protein [Hexamita inflata]
MSASVFDQLQQTQIEYNYSARAIILAEAAADQTYIQNMLDFLLLDDRQQNYILSGVCAQFGNFVLLQLEGKVDQLVRFLAILQPFCQRWSELDPTHPLCVASRSRTPVFKKTVMLLFEENVRPMISTFKYVQTNVLKNDISHQNTLQQQITHTVAAMLKITSLVNLSLQTTSNPLQTVLQLHDELPNMQNLYHILQIQESDAPQTKTVPALSTFDQTLTKDQENRMHAVEEKYETFMKEDTTIFKVENEAAMELDEFVYDLLLCNKVELIEEVGNLNENWAYENLKHILGKK